jgi:hypothetical protein
MERNDMLSAHASRTIRLRVRFPEKKLCDYAYGLKIHLPRK